MKNIFKVKDYRLVYQDCPANLTKAVQLLLNDGWIPFLNPFGDSDCSDDSFSYVGQALVKEPVEVAGQKITQYKLIVEKSALVLSENVKKHLESGWLLYGSPFGDSSPDTTFVYQAMVKC